MDSKRLNIYGCWIFTTNFKYWMRIGIWCRLNYMDHLPPDGDITQFVLILPLLDMFDWRILWIKHIWKPWILNFGQMFLLDFFFFEIVIFWMGRGVRLGNYWFYLNKIKLCTLRTSFRVKFNNVKYTFNLAVCTFNFLQVYTKA